MVIFLNKDKVDFKGSFSRLYIRGQSNFSVSCTDAIDAVQSPFSSNCTIVYPSD